METYDAIVIGSGISGGWAAKELTEKGLRTIMLERRHPRDGGGTDGACMTSSACQNPSLTYMALTARAADFAVTELKKGNI
jgi:choline dehydrogenase-like flavoprotein